MGLTRQEATVYQQLLMSGKQTGYEIAKETGISRSNAYAALSSLVDKGAAYMMEESAKKYIPVSLEEFCNNHIHKMQEIKIWLLDNQPKPKMEEEGYITIEGEKHVLDKIRVLLNQVEERVYVSCTVETLELFRKELEKLLQDGKKVVIVTDDDYELPKAKIYRSERKGRQLGIITDSRFTLTGEYGTDSTNTCLYSGQKNLVTLFKSALANEIKLINYMKVPNTKVYKGKIRRENK